MAEARHAILGGGLSGLTLAVELVRRGAARDGLVLVEPRLTYGRDRTWCFWDVQEHSFEDAQTHDWRRWRVRHAGREIVHASPRFRYREIPGDRFYRSALERIRGAEGVEIMQPARVEDVRSDGDAFVVETDAGTFRARHVHDSRPPRAGPALGQHFVGQEVELAHDGFDPSTVELMDFDVPQDRGIHFMYVLPYTRRRALVEATFIGDGPFAPDVYRRAVARYVREHTGAHAFDVRYEERGLIPMVARPPEPTVMPGWYRIGSAAGHVRPSTGYAFLEVQRWSRRFAARLVRADRPAPPASHSGLARLLDAIFLARLRAAPEAGPGLFYRMFAETEPDALVSFLTGTAAPKEVWRVIRALPALPMLRQAALLAARSLGL